MSSSSSSDNGFKNLKYDKRMTEWMVNNGQLSKEDLKKHMDELPDLTNKVDMLRMAEEKYQAGSGEAH